MKTLHLYIFKVFAIFILALLFTSTVIGGLRRICLAIQSEIIRPSEDTPNFSPSQLTKKIDSEPNTLPSRLSVCIGDGFALCSFGIIDAAREVFAFEEQTYFIRSPKQKDDPYENNDLSAVISYDKKSSLYVYTKLNPSKDWYVNRQNIQLILYAGPNGIGQEPSPDLGRFINPASTANRFNPILIIYDEKQHRFLEYDFENRNLRQGPPQADDIQVAQLQQLMKNAFAISFNWEPSKTLQWIKKGTDSFDYYHNGHWLSPIETKTEPDGTIMELRYVPDRSVRWVNEQSHLLGFIPVLLDSGDIVKLDPETLQLSDTLGKLPHAKPDDLLAYYINPFLLNDQYHALAVATLSRHAQFATLSLFDNKGQLIKLSEKENYDDDDWIRRRRYYDSSTEAFRQCDIGNVIGEQPGGPLTITLLFITECFQAPVVQLGSLYYGNSLEPLAAMRTLVWMPDSIMAKVLPLITNEIERFGFILFFMVPSLLFSLFLAWRVVRDGKIIGVCRGGRRCWFWGTILFGLPMYITYRLVRPATVLVTCPNCGKGRRPDSDICHQCGAVWRPAELEAPAWRIVESA